MIFATLVAKRCCVLADTNTKNRAKSKDLALFFGVPRGTRTPDPLLRRQMLYPAELSRHLDDLTIIISYLNFVKPFYKLSATTQGIYRLQASRHTGRNESKHRRKHRNRCRYYYNANPTVLDDITRQIKHKTE